MAELTLFTATNETDVIYCLERGDKINEWVNERTPFIYHCINNNIEVVLSLIQHNCDVAQAPPYRLNGLELVCELGHSELLRKMLRYTNIHNLLNKSYVITTPLLIACKNGHSDIFDILVEYGADINLSNNKNKTPLIAACEYAQEDIVKRLLILGANVNKCDNYSRTPIFYCTNVNILHLLYINDADINIQDMFDCTPLHVHIMGIYDDVSEALIDLAPDLNIINEDGETALMIAIDNRKINIVKKLLEAKADVNITDNEGNTAFDHIDNKFTPSTTKVILTDLLNRWNAITVN